jgi:hypothetical protein
MMGYEFRPQSHLKKIIIKTKNYAEQNIMLSYIGSEISERKIIKLILSLENVDILFIIGLFDF